MKAEELMIGDWVYNTHNRQPEQVCEIREHRVMLAYNDLYDYDEIEPIPLNDEILQKNGFRRVGERWGCGDVDLAFSSFGIFTAVFRKDLLRDIVQKFNGEKPTDGQVRIPNECLHTVIYPWSGVLYANPKEV